MPKLKGAKKTESIKTGQIECKIPRCPNIFSGIERRGIFLPIFELYLSMSGSIEKDSNSNPGNSERLRKPTAVVPARKWVINLMSMKGLGNYESFSISS